MSDMDFDDMGEGSDQRKMFLLGGIVLVVGIVIAVLIVLFFSEEGDEETVAEDREVFELSESDQDDLLLRSNEVVSIVGNYGVLSEVNGDTYVDLNAEFFGVYNTDAATLNIRTRAGVVKLLEEGFLLSSSFDLDSDAVSYNLASFTSKVSASDLSVKVPVVGYFSNGRSFVEVPASFVSHQVLHVAEGESPETGWQGIVNVLEKIVDEEVVLVFEKVGDDWLLFRVDGLNEIYSMGIVSASTADVNTINMSSFMDAGNFDTGVRSEGDIHTHEHFEDMDEPSSEDSYSESDVAEVINKLRIRYTAFNISFTEESLRSDAEEFLRTYGPNTDLLDVDGLPEVSPPAPPEDNYESRYGSGSEFTPDTNE